MNSAGNKSSTSGVDLDAVSLKVDEGIGVSWEFQLVQYDAITRLPREPLCKDVETIARIHHEPDLLGPRVDSAFRSRSQP